MITVTAREKAESLTLCVTGHAGFGPKGADIVCAAASILTYTAAKLARDMERRGQLREKPLIRLKPGEAEVRFTPREDSRPRAEVGLETTLLGFRLLEEQYPRYIRVKGKGNV